MGQGKRPWKRRCERKYFRKSRPIFSEHHLVPISQGGEGGPTILTRDDKHRAWHLLVRNSLPKEAATILSGWLPKEDRFFSFNKSTPIGEIIDAINEWRGEIAEDKNALKIIRLYPHCWDEVGNFPKLSIFQPSIIS